MMTHQVEKINKETEIIYLLENQTENFPGGAVVKNPPADAGTQVRALVQEDPPCCGATKPTRHNY